MKKKLLSLVLTLAMVLSLVPLSALAAAPEGGYQDTKGHWAEAAIDRWSGYGIVEGNGGMFYPDASMTRAQVAKVYANLLGLTLKVDLSGYTDVDPTAWYYDSLAKCVAADILQGGGNGTLSPDAPVSREQMFVMLARALGIAPESQATVAFTDADQISAWAVGYINALASRGIVTGSGDGTVNPKANIDRASVMALLDKAVGSYVTTDNATVAAKGGLVLVVANHVTVTGSADILVVAGGDNAVTVAGAVESAAVVGPASTVVLAGGARVGTMSISPSARRSSVMVQGGATLWSLDTQADNVSVSGSGTVYSAVVSGDNTVVNTTGTHLTVSVGTTGVTQNGQSVAGGQTVDTKPVAPPVHVHSYVVSEIKAADAPGTTVALQYTCYAGDHTYVELNGNAVAQVGSDYYVNLANALNTVNNGTVILLQNTTLTDPVTIRNTATFNMNGKTVTVDTAGIIDLTGSGSLTVTGNGKMIQLMTSELGFLFRAEGNSSLVLENGHYIAGLTCVQAGDSEGGNAVVKISGGTFETLVGYSNTNWHLNLIDNSPAEIIVSGGTFKNYNPAESHTENPVANFVADGYTVTTSQNGEDTWYTVVPLTAENSEAVVDGTYYETLADAIAAGGNVTVLKDVSDFTSVVLSNDTTLDLNGHAITCSSTEPSDIFLVSGHISFTIKDSVGNGLISMPNDYSTGQMRAVVVANDGAKITMDGGKIIAGNESLSGSAAQNAGGYGIAVFNDSSFTMNGGTISAAWFCVSTNGTVDESSSSYGSNAVITINNGTLISRGDYAIYAPAENGTTTINGGTIQGAWGALQIKRGTLVIANGVLSNIGESVGQKPSDQADGSTPENGYPVISADGAYGVVNVTISGGTFTTTDGYTTVVVPNSPQYNVTVTVTGGTFSDHYTGTTAN